jgi:hypothetical protein
MTIALTQPKFQFLIHFQYIHELQENDKYFYIPKQLQKLEF